MIALAALAVALPFLSAAVVLLGSRWPGHARGGPADTAANRRAAWIAAVPTAASAALAVWLASTHWARFGDGRRGPFPFAAASDVPAVTGTLTVVDTGSVPIALGLQLDGLSTAVAVLVTVVALAVQVYSIGYLHGDRRYPSYSAFVSLFTAAMLLVVYAADLIVLYVGWEIMGLCSYLLVGHWWEERANSRAAVKAFLVTRLGDVGFLFGIFVLGSAAGSFKVADVLAAVPDMSSGTVVAATMLLLAGVAGKSAQVPLHTWLPDAMAGPTPISALIHAATMVAAGIFLVARLYPVFLQAGPTLDVLAILAALGMLGAALAALAQDDLKRVLAYSTISQLAYMAAALAAGSDGAAVFHLITHGAFKALLFLCAGAVIHAVGSNLMSAMGGLRRELPVTFAAMTIGFAALMGLPPASGFFSKDEVLVAVERAVSQGPLTDAAALLLYGSALATVAVTGAYATRAWLRTFFGERPAVALPEPAPGTAHVIDVHEAPATMRRPILVLAVPALLLGFAGAAGVHWGTAALSVAVALLGAGAVYAVWRSDPRTDPARMLGPFRAPCERAFYVDTAYRKLFVGPVLALAGLVVRTDDRAVDGAVRGSGRAALGLSGLMRSAQNGNLQLYLTGLLAGVLLIAVGAVVLG
ncbi:NADH-quinone oxidoreductase subunit 5 family protein [Planomonospora parontospora]|uniref:NADH-quinone oxidoreductase subunit 5 family protein n=1 Tax=Planomonospora parontospora TaxID=58119 RepID=UPI001670EE32|nr:NADH-quinone oxidoreductase subunit L [Planomonospora parontospora]GGL24432.1 NADH dehydrogenase [Planomonospora parontospora subsp. antibiotica]GII15125.1 NADH dehydrogenase [Planomonospora parontospora subsp. antibiotica]